MSAVLVSKEKNRAVFTVELPSEKLEEAIQKAYLKNKSRFSLPGFRKGHVPRKILEMNYGVEIFFEDAVNMLLPDAYEEAVEELELEPVAQPEVDVDELEKGSPVKFKFEVDVKPEVELGDYSNLEAEVNKYEVTDEDISRVIDRERDQNSRIISVEDRAVKDGDIVNIDFVGKLDGEEFPGGDAEGYELVIGSGAFIPGFEEQIIGKEIGQEFDVDVVFPEEYHDESLAGKNVIFEVKLNSIQEKELPELDDEFVKDISEFDTLEEYKNNVKIDLEEELKKQAEVEKENKAVEALMEVMKVDIPESMIDMEVDREYQNFLYRVQGMGLTLDQYFAIANSDEEKTREELRPASEKKVKGELALDEFIVKENIEATDDEIDKEISELAKQYELKDVDSFKETLKESGDLDFITNTVKRRKAVEKLVEMVKYKEA
ncbi:trigger factor [Lagierella massiliensis]|uniref:trigger factor n=1 Tax=Lagierella massiliensis TaxID=1689303 RepID=UPI0006D7D711|nr:trigger factor [Lagierella massiliensis]